MFRNFLARPAYYRDHSDDLPAGLAWQHGAPTGGDAWGHGHNPTDNGFHSTGRHHVAPGHDKDCDDVFDHGHDQHGNGHGYGHDTHCEPAPPPPEPDCTDVDENQTFVFDLDSAGELSGQAGDTGVVYEIVGGADASLLQVDRDTGELTFIDAPDFEAPLDADGDNSYEVTVRATSASHPHKYVDQPFRVCVQDVDETGPEPGPNAGPQIVLPGQTVIPINVDSRGKVVADIDAVDPDGRPEPITFALSGEDADFFEFNTETGEISAPADVQLFEIAGQGDDQIFVPLAQSADGDFVFEVTVMASNGLDADAVDLQLPLYLAG